MRFGRPLGPNAVEIVNGITLTAAGTAHTKGSWTDLDASVLNDVMGWWMWHSTGNAVSGQDRAILIDIGIGSTGNAVDETLIANVPMGYTNSQSRWFFPLHLRKGERLAARIQATVASDAVIVGSFHHFAQGAPAWGGYAKGEIITPMDLASSHPTMSDFTDNVYEEIVASTSREYRGFNWWPDIVGTGGNSNEHHVTLAVGAAAAEQVIGSWATRQANTESLQSRMGPLWIEHPVPAGQRLSVRKWGSGNLTGAFAGYW